MRGRPTNIDRKATSLVLPGHRPVAMHPEFPIVGSEAKGCGLWNGNELVLKALPEVQAVLVRLEGGIHLLNATDVVWNAEETIGAGVESR